MSLLLAACGGAAAPAASPSASAASASAAGSAAASGLTKITVAYSVPSPGFWALYMAADAGIFQKNGLDATLQLVSGAPNAAAALISGQLQFAQFGGGAAMSSAANGADLVILAIVVPVDQFVIYGAPDIKTGADLKGKKLGVVALGGSEDNIAMRAGVRYVGLDPDKDVSILPVGQDRVTALLNGSVDAATLTPPDTLQVEPKGFHSVVDLAAAKLPHLGQSTVASRSYVNAHHDVAQKYVDSIIEAIAQIKQNRAQAEEILGKRIKTTDQKSLDVAYDFYTKEIFPDLPDPNPALFQDAITELSKEDPKIKTFDPNSVVDRSFVQNAASRGLGK
ncbi:MAG TPA: ABC transporter substrate-binding protein [Chloroflexota bacterium]|nr:ABC transporter substrate-binding protein [Chloroflexota bacterium]